MSTVNLRRHGHPNEELTRTTHIVEKYMFTHDVVEKKLTIHRHEVEQSGFDDNLSSV